MVLRPVSGAQFCGPRVFSGLPWGTEYPGAGGIRPESSDESPAAPLPLHGAVPGLGMPGSTELLNSQPFSRPSAGLQFPGSPNHVERGDLPKGAIKGADTDARLISAADSPRLDMPGLTEGLHVIEVSWGDARHHPSDRSTETSALIIQNLPGPRQPV